MCAYCFFFIIRRPPRSTRTDTLFPYTTLFRAKALIALYAAEADFEFRIVDADHPENVEVVQSAGPLAKFPVLRDGENLLFESTTIIEYVRSEEHTSELQSIMRISYAAFCLKQKKHQHKQKTQSLNRINNN